MLRATCGLSRLLSHLRWLFMPAGMFALLALGLHAGALVAGDRLLAALDWADGHSDAALTAAIAFLGPKAGWTADRIDAWTAAAVGLLDLSERAGLARWAALALEFWTVWAVALPSLGYREGAAPNPTSPIRAVACRATTGAAGAPSSLRELAVRSLRDPTALRLLLPAATLGAALAGACRAASELEAQLFSALTSAPPALGSAAARFCALFALGGLLVSLGGRAVAQALWHAHGRAEADRLAGCPPLRRRLRGLARLAPALPLALAAAAGAPLLSFFR